MSHNRFVELVEKDLNAAPPSDFPSMNAASCDFRQRLQHTGHQALSTTSNSKGLTQDGPMVRFLCSCPNFHFGEVGSIGDRQFVGARILLMTSQPDQ
jgi:hypothetical protein